MPLRRRRLLERAAKLALRELGTLDAFLSVHRRNLRPEARHMPETVAQLLEEEPDATVDSGGEVAAEAVAPVEAVATEGE